MARYASPGQYARLYSETQRVLGVLLNDEFGPRADPQYVEHVSRYLESVIQAEERFESNVCRGKAGQSVAGKIRFIQSLGESAARPLWAKFA